MAGRKRKRTTPLSSRASSPSDESESDQALAKRRAGLRTNGLSANPLSDSARASALRDIEEEENREPEDEEQAKHLSPGHAGRRRRGTGLSTKEELEVPEVDEHQINVEEVAEEHEDDEEDTSLTMTAEDGKQKEDLDLYNALTRSIAERRSWASIRFTRMGKNFSSVQKRYVARVTQRAFADLVAVHMENSYK